MTTLDQLRDVRRSRRVRATAVTLSLTGLALGLFVVTLLVGSFRLSLGEVFGSVTHLVDDPAVDFIVRDLRLPVAVSALCVGAALGASGTIFQQLLRNPLASPDFVGVSAGASVAAVAGIVLWGTTSLVTCFLALGGAIVGSLLMYVLAWRDGISGYRFILIGIGVAATFEGITGYLLTRATVFDAREAIHWLTGTVGRADDAQQYALAASLVVLLPLAVLLQRQLRLLELGDDTARGLGGRTELAKVGLISLAVLLIALATAVAGPIAFVALVAGPLAQRLLGPAAGGILPAALVGAALLLGADLVATQLLPVALPTGVVTGALGAPYLVWLLATANREGQGG
ncbi:FecCD family ABC transporter permease [Nocardioides hwasunensis]|uniref:Iron chelate uptake ABC transporter family permease subunit n=1 Tax=Nocardioides hwasunensis TaxID=397258 RepID=A0ABR8MIL5_9ACTN|nr:iron chelate uptake ABC transporter family permease subunit [Nocardioides hwasunensis]MBD3914580.1 iron chelate uptake ABC transporter family permease subunit [Nocardioides hwasunensis]